jgi:Uncharacterized protein conserved in bacteria (DUF2188)
VAKSAPIHTVKVEGGWQNKAEGAAKGSKTFRTQAEAVAAGREDARKKKTEHLIHGQNGQIRMRNSYGADSRRRPG